MTFQAYISSIHVQNLFILQFKFCFLSEKEKEKREAPDATLYSAPKCHK